MRLRKKSRVKNRRPCLIRWEVTRKGRMSPIFSPDTSGLPDPSEIMKHVNDEHSKNTIHQWKSGRSTRFSSCWFQFLLQAYAAGAMCVLSCKCKMELDGSPPLPRLSVMEGLVVAQHSYEHISEQMCGINEGLSSSILAITLS